MNKDLILEKGDIVHCKSKCAMGKIIVASDFNGNSIDEFEKAYMYQVMKVDRPVKYKRIYEFKEILDKKEKEYLSYVIRPFRNRVKNIKKISHHDYKKCWIKIKLTTDEGIDFPFFKEDTMYKGMEMNKEYTLKELGL